MLAYDPEVERGSGQRTLGLEALFEVEAGAAAGASGDGLSAGESFSARIYLVQG